MLKVKLLLERAISCLSFCNKEKLFEDRYENYEIYRIPVGKEVYSEFRIIDDCENEDKNYWKEVLFDNERIFLHPNDIIIRISSKKH